MPEIIIPFGGGIHSRAFPQDINRQEAASGQNFDLDPQNRTLRNRKGFDLIGTAPNAGRINGFASLLKSDGTVSMLIQADDTVYDWDGDVSFTSKGTVSSNARLRGRIEHNWQLDDKVIITDIALAQPVMEYDGTTLQNISFLSNPSTAWVGDFKARYCAIIDERVIFANIEDNSSAFPHMIVGAKRGDYTTLSVSDRPSSSIAESDPFFLIQPDYRYINGMVESFGILATSSRKGSFWKLTGGSAQDFAFSQLYPMSGASGNESVAFVGNDVVYGREGRIESLVSTDQFGDVSTNDLSLPISDLIDSFDDWTIVYNSRTQRIYCIPAGRSQLWVLHKPMLETELSPWVKWVTAEAVAFNPTAIMNCYDPDDGLEYVFFGDSSGNIYRLEGASEGDNSTAIRTKFKSGLFKVEGINEEAYNVTGYIEYKSENAITPTIRLIWQGQTILIQEITESIPAADTGAVYGGGYYYGDGSVYGSVTGLIRRQQIAIPGQSEMFQLEIEIDDAEDFEIVEVGLKFQQS